ncbi:MAG: hypothetical protein KGZ44_09225 [Dethiobacter sp.]|nr:hypothetical protein [Dethiobacter sp.]
MTNLKGSEKQVAWAEEIRGSFMAQAEKILNAGRGLELLNHIRNIDSAKWWIDNRDKAKTVRGLLDMVARQIFEPIPGSPMAILYDLAKQGYKSGDITLKRFLDSGAAIKIISQSENKIIAATEDMGTVEFTR